MCFGKDSATTPNPKSKPNADLSDKKNEYINMLQQEHENFIESR